LGIFAIFFGRIVSINGLTIRNGKFSAGAEGGGVQMPGALTMNNVNVYGNSVTGGGRWRVGFSVTQPWF
jgi:hypothetical protein